MSTETIEWRQPVIFSTAVKSAVDAVKAMWRRTSNERELQALDDRLLADIGIDRGQIPLIARGLLTRSDLEAEKSSSLRVVADAIRDRRADVPTTVEKEAVGRLAA